MARNGLYKLFALFFCMVPTLALSEEVDINSASLQDLIDGKWYEVELIVFKRLSIQATSEQLVVPDPPIWPPNIQSLTSQENDSIVFSERDIKAEGDPFCVSDEKADFPDGLKLILSQGYEPEMLNDFDAISSQVLNIEKINLHSAEEEDSDLTKELTQQNSSLEHENIPITQNPSEDNLLESVTQEIIKFEDYLRQASFLELQENQKDLTYERQLLDEEPDLLVTHHLSWLQSVPERGKPISIMVAETEDNVAGYVRVTIGRYLHFETDLWTTIGKRDDMAPPQENQFVALRESRRMRSNELHYLDHPALGVITKISPYSIDSNIAKRWLEAQNPGASVN